MKDFTASYIKKQNLEENMLYLEAQTYTSQIPELRNQIWQQENVQREKLKCIWKSLKLNFFVMQNHKKKKKQPTTPETLKWHFSLTNYFFFLEYALDIKLF